MREQVVIPSYFFIRTSHLEPHLLLPRGPIEVRGSRFEVRTKNEEVTPLRISNEEFENRRQTSERQRGEELQSLDGMRAVPRDEMSGERTDHARVRRVADRRR